MINYSLNYRKVTVKNSAGELVVAYKAYATAQITRNVNCDEFFDHLESKHNSVYSKSDYRAMIHQLCLGIIDRCSDGVKVQVGNFGAFYPSISASGVTDPSQFYPSSDIKKVYVNWAKNRRFANFDNNKTKPTYGKKLTRVNEANAVQANNVGNEIMVLHTTASKEAAFA